MRLVKLFPRSWRERYGEEFEALLEESDLSARDLIDVLHGVWDAHIRPQPQFDLGGQPMSEGLRRGLWTAAAALAALVLLVAVYNFFAQRTVMLIGVGVDLSATALAGLGVGIGLVAAALWRLGRLRTLRVFLALLAVRVIQVSLSTVLVGWTYGPLVPLYQQIDPLGLGWLPPTLFTVATGVALAAALSRFLRLRLITAVVIGMGLELLIGPSTSLLTYLQQNGLEKALYFVFSAPPTVVPGAVLDAVQTPSLYLDFIGLVLWALVLQQIALRRAADRPPQPLAPAYLAFARAHWAPIAALIVVVALARFSLPTYLNSDAVQNPAHFTPTSTDVQAQMGDCLKAYGMNLPNGVYTKTTKVPSGVAARCANIITRWART